MGNPAVLRAEYAWTGENSDTDMGRVDWREAKHDGKKKDRVLMEKEDWAIGVTVPAAAKRKNAKTSFEAGEYLLYGGGSVDPMEAGLGRVGLKTDGVGLRITTRAPDVSGGVGFCLSRAH